jgi:2,5-diamino-6-(ribosylamino)-4(3H)-pyrimidinone 5'-phosphate reductase
VLLEQGLVDEVQLLVAPEIVGKKAVNLFRSLNKAVKLQLLKSEVVEKNHVLLAYKVLKR